MLCRGVNCVPESEETPRTWHVTSFGRNVIAGVMMSRVATVGHRGDWCPFRKGRLDTEAHGGKAM